MTRHAIAQTDRHDSRIWPKNTNWADLAGTMMVACEEVWCYRWEDRFALEGAAGVKQWSIAHEGDLLLFLGHSFTWHQNSGKMGHGLVYLNVTTQEKLIYPEQWHLRENLRIYDGKEEPEIIDI